MRLASNMTSVAPQVPEGVKGKREPGGGGGAAGADILRSRFQTTAFFLGSVVTDAQGNATVTAKLPDNLTTFRIMAVAVTAGDRYGKGRIDAARHASAARASGVAALRYGPATTSRPAR